MIPFREEMRARVFPIGVYAIIALNIIIFIHEATLPDPHVREAFIDGFGLTPYNLTHDLQFPAPAPPAVLTLVTSQFLHASILHIFFNMLFLAVFGPEIELLTGHVRFVLFYLTCGILGDLAQWSIMPDSHVPSIGASGAIAGILGAFLLRFPARGIETIVPVGCFPLFLRLPAFFVIGLWAGAQFAHGFGPLATNVLSEQGGGTAYFAHIGGFLAGVFLVGSFAHPPGVREAPRRPYDIQ